MAKRTTRLMILGVIAYRQPISGYGIEKTLAEWAVHRWTTIVPASIYQQLRSLSAAALIEPTSGTGRAVSYTCTAAGREELRTLLLSVLNDEDLVPLSLIPLLHFTPTLTAGELTAGLTRRIALLDTAIAGEADVIKQVEHHGPRHISEIFRLTWRGLDADRQWCREFLDRLARPDDHDQAG